MKNAIDRRTFLNRLNYGALTGSALLGPVSKAWAAKDEGASAGRHRRHDRWKDSRRSTR